MASAPFDEGLRQRQAEPRAGAARRGEGDEEALADPGLRKKYAELFRFFYGEEGILIQEVRAGLKGLSGS